MSRLSAQSYARALETVLATSTHSPARVMEALRVVIGARRDHHKRAAIIRAYRARMREMTKTHTLHITCARELSPEELTPIRHAFTESFRPSIVTTSINPELVAGVQLTLDDQYLIDFSARGIIDRIFP